MLDRGREERCWIGGVGGVLGRGRGVGEGERGGVLDRG